MTILSISISNSIRIRQALLLNVSRQRTCLRASQHVLVQQKLSMSTRVAPSTTTATNSNNSNISISYEEWAAAKRRSNNEQTQTRHQKQQQHKQKQTQKKKKKSYNPMIEDKISSPSTYNSIMMFPEQMTLKWPHEQPNKSNKDEDEFQLNCQRFAISKPNKGGHIILGRNGSGKSLLVKCLLSSDSSDDDSSSDDDHVHNNDEIAHVSFDSQIQILEEHGRYLTVHDLITGGEGNLTKTAQYLVVRFGLKPFLSRKLSTLSTGEIRKSMLVSSLSKSPQLLILENAFDGLDVESRNELQSIVKKALQGLDKSGKLLVQAVNNSSNNANYVPPHATQIIMSTHRPEEIFDEISVVSWINDNNDNNNHNNHNNHSNTNTNTNDLITVHRPKQYSKEQLMFASLGLDKDHNKCNNTYAILPSWQENDPTLPSINEIQQLWNTKNQNNNNNNNNVNNVNNNVNNNNNNKTLFAFDNVEIRRLRDGGYYHNNNNSNKIDDVDQDDNDEDEYYYATLIKKLSWDIQKGQRWIVKGKNGAGKSTLTRFLAKRLLLSSGHHEDDDDDEEEEEEGGQQTNPSNPSRKSKSDHHHHHGELLFDTTKDIVTGKCILNSNTIVGFLSTESHESHLGNNNNNNNDNKNRNKNNTTTKTKTTAWDIICHHGNVSDEIAQTVVGWVFGGGKQDNNKLQLQLRNCTIEELSQGQQKLCLLASALAIRPNLLILDEPTQGLDWINRRRILALLERLCEATSSTTTTTNNNNNNNDDDNNDDNDVDVDDNGGMSLIFITHYDEEWMDNMPSISHVLHLDDGNAIYQGTRKSYNPTSLF